MFGLEAFFRPQQIEQASDLKEIILQKPKIRNLVEGYVAKLAESSQTAATARLEGAETKTFEPRHTSRLQQFFIDHMTKAGVEFPENFFVAEYQKGDVFEQVMAEIPAEESDEIAAAA